MKRENYEFLKTLIDGMDYTFDFTDNSIRNKYGKKMTVFTSNGRTPVVNLKGKNYSLVQVMAVVCKKKIVGKVAIFKDKNNKNLDLNNVMWVEHRLKNRFNPNTKLDQESVNIIRDMNMTSKEIMIMTGISREHAGRVINNKTWV